MTARTGTRTSQVVGIAILVAIIAVIVGLVVGQYGYYQPDKAGAAEHPEIGSKSCASCHDHKHQEPYLGECETCHTTSSWLATHYTHENPEFNTSFHAIIGCERCHDEGEPLPSAACESCHAARSPHDVGPVACAPCHTVLAWSMQRPIPEDHLSLEGGHEGLSCFECHTAGVEVPASGARGCVDCHGPNHGGLTDCESCHEPSRGWEPLPGFDHSLFFKLEGKHTLADCADCHKNNTFAGTPTVCQGCHPVAHKNLTLCEQCHTPHGFVPSSFDHDKYFPITGGHTKLDCLACHPKGIYDGTPTVCTGCHGSAHGGLTACQSCHTTKGFVPSTFNHASRFPLVGAHASVACSSCHPQKKYAQNIGGGSTACSACHTSPHGSGITTCTACHKPTAWSDILLTEHPGEIKLGTAHTERACTLCHPTLKFIDDAPKPCQDCHLVDVPHVGPANCLDCHRPTTWAELHFTHPDTGVHEARPWLNSYCLRCHPGPDFTIVDCTSCHIFVPPSSNPTATPFPVPTVDNIVPVPELLAPVPEQPVVDQPVADTLKDTPATESTSSAE